jgi:hypothetical protein
LPSGLDRRDINAPKLSILMRNTMRNVAEGCMRLIDIVTRQAFVVVRGKAY